MKGVYNFSGGADLPAFLQAAKDAGLLVLLRAGPYMCGEKIIMSNRVWVPRLCWGRRSRGTIIGSLPKEYNDHIFIFLIIINL